MSGSLRCVIDASLCIKQFIDDPLTPKVDRLFDHLSVPATEFFVPDLFYIECANTLWKYVRAKLYSAERVREDLRDLKELQLQVISTKDLISEAVQIGIDYGITAYDGCYVALSEQAKAPLLTLDERLVNALKSSSFNVVGFADFIVPPL